MTRIHGYFLLRNNECSYKNCLSMMMLEFWYPLYIAAAKGMHVRSLTT